MPDYVDPLRSFFQTTRRCCSFVSGFICSLIPGRCADLIGTKSSSSSELLAERENYLLATLSAMDPIDITSSDSDSDWDLEEYRKYIATPPRDSVSSANLRILPEWASGLDTSRGLGGSREPETSRQSGSAASVNQRGLPERVSGYGNGGPSKQIPPKLASFSNGNSSSASRSLQSKPQMRLSPPDDVRASTWHFDQPGNSMHLKENDDGKHSSHLASTRTLPTSLQPFRPTSAVSGNRAENVGSSNILDIHGKSYNPEWPNLASSKNYMKDHIAKSREDEVIMYEKNGNRMLPPSLMHGKSVSGTQYVNSSDPVYRAGNLGEERVAGTDERLIYQAALQDLNQPKVEASLPDGLLSVSLLRHQKIALAWMLQKETTSLHCLGGILADDQGLGKTVSMIALIQIQRPLQSKSKSGGLDNQKTEALNLDDDDENGAAPPDKCKQTGECEEIKVIPVPDVSTSMREFRRRRPAAGTLVVCPASILRQWARELDDKVANEAKLSVLIYHGSNRTKDPVELAKYDVVLTTYSIVTNEVPKQPLVEEDEDDEKNGERFGLSSDFSSSKKRKKTSTVSKRGKKGKKGIDSSAFDCDCGALARVGWFRVILDEAQTIKNHRTQVARACCGLRAKRRWCLSGTPIQNAIDELYSYFRFLKYDPYAAYRSFCNTIKIPISRNSIHGYKKLQAVLRAIMLRRTKGTLIDGEPIINLPPKTTHLSKVDFSAEERAFYSKLEADSRSKFKAYAAAGTVNQNYANILLMLLRLRQACDHPLLVKEFNSDSVGRASLELANKLPRDMQINLLNLLETSLAICRACNDPPEDSVITMCGHVFCYQCVSDYLTGDDNTCPVPECKEQLGTDVVFSKAILRRCLSDDPDSDTSYSSEVNEKSMVMQNEYVSSKIRAALQIIQTHCTSKNTSPEIHKFVRCNGNSEEQSCAENSHSGVSAVKRTTVTQNEGPIKAIVFSQWTSMLDLVEFSLNQSCIQYRRLDGTMSLAARDRAVKEFNSDSEVTVMLMSLKAGNLGLNMVAACHVILMDLWWNPTTEDQAVDRAHRIGQTRPVTVSRLTIKDTVEDRILALQEEKRKMVASAFGEDQSGGSATRLTVEDLKYLFMV